MRASFVSDSSSLRMSLAAVQSTSRMGCAAIGPPLLAHIHTRRVVASVHTPERPPRGSDRLLRSLRGEVLLELVLLDLVGGRARDVRDDADVRRSHELGHLLLCEPV